MLPALILLRSMALCIPKSPVLHHSMAPVVRLLYGKRLTKLCCTRELGPGPGTDALSMVGAGRCHNQGAAPWEFSDRRWW